MAALGREGRKRGSKLVAHGKDKGGRRLAKERESEPEPIIGRIPLWVPVKTCDLASAVDF